MSTMNASSTERKFSFLSPKERGAALRAARGSSARFGGRGAGRAGARRGSRTRRRESAARPADARARGRARHVTRRRRPSEASAKKLEQRREHEAEPHGREVTTSPQPRRVYIVFDYVKGEAPEVGQGPRGGEAAVGQDSPGADIGANIGQRPRALRVDALRVTGRGNWGHARRARCRAPSAIPLARRSPPGLGAGRARRAFRKSRPSRRCHRRTPVTIRLWSRRCGSEPESIIATSSSGATRDASGR